MQKIIELQVIMGALTKPNFGEKCNDCGLRCIYTTCSEQNYCSGNLMETVRLCNGISKIGVKSAVC